MRITNSFNLNFAALFGKKEITTHYNKDGSMRVDTIQHVYPFRNEFKSEEDKIAWIESLRATSFYKNQNNSLYGVDKNYKVVIEPELCFSQEIFEQAKKDGVDLLKNRPDFYSVVTKSEGYYPSIMFSDGKFDCLA